MVLSWARRLCSVLGHRRSLTKKMAVSESEKNGSNFGQLLKPFYQRASEAEERLSRLEVALESNKGAGNEELLEAMRELQSKLDAANSELASEQEKAKKLAVENAKLQYRVVHLVRAAREGDSKLESIAGGSAQTMSKLEDLRL